MLWSKPAHNHPQTEVYLFSTGSKSVITSACPRKQTHFRKDDRIRRKIPHQIHQSRLNRWELNEVVVLLAYKETQ